MKKQLSTILSSLLITSAVSAQDVNIQSGWQLLGATSNVDLTKLNASSCTDYVWKYNANTADVNNRWELHVANGQTYNYTGTPVSSINAGEGFWLLGNDNCPNINISEATSTTPDTSTGFTLAMIEGNTFYSVTETLSQPAEAYTTVAEFYTNGTRSYSRDGVPLADANYEVVDGDLHIYNTSGTNILLRIVPTTGTNYTMLEMYNNSGATPILIGKRYTFASQAELDVFIANTTTNTLAMTTEASTTLAFGSFSSSINFEPNDSHWYNTLSLNFSNPIIATITDYDYTGSAWAAEDPFSGEITVNNDQNASFAEGTFGADMILTKTEKITALNGNTYTDLFISDVDIYVTLVDPNDSWTDIWNWSPRDSDNNPITTNEGLKTVFLTQNNWLGGSNTYGMLSGSTSDTSGNVVQGIQVGYWDGCTITTDNDCKKILRTSQVIGSWTYDNAGIHVDLPNEMSTLSIIFNSNSDTDYSVQSIGQDKVGAVWHEKWLTGSEATEAVVQQLLQ